MKDLHGGEKKGKHIYSPEEQGICL